MERKYVWTECLKCGCEAGTPLSKFDGEDPKETVENFYMCLESTCDGKQKFTGIIED